MFLFGLKILENKKFYDSAYLKVWETWNEYWKSMLNLISFELIKFILFDTIK